MGSSAQGGQMRPQQPQQAPMGGQQGKGPGLPMPQQGGDRSFQSQPYQPIGVNNPPFNPNPVQPTPGNMPAQGKAPGQLPQGITPQMVDAFKMQQMNNPQAMPMQPGMINPMMQQAVQGQQMPGGKGPTR